MSSRRSFVQELLVLDYGLKRNARRYLLYLNAFSILLLQVSGNCCSVAHLLPELFLELASSVSKVVHIGLDSVKSELASV